MSWKPARRTYDEDAYYDDYKDRKMEAEMELRREREAALEREQAERRANIERQKTDPIWGTF